MYGRSITFHRTIYDTGATTVYTRDFDDNKVSSNKDARDEGKRILERFRINVDNPIAVLQQEEAKELLKVESPEALYQFFQKSTLLKQCIEQYSGAKTEIETTKELVKNKKKSLDELKVQFDIKKKDYEKQMKLQRLNDDERRVSQEFVLAKDLENKEEVKKLSLEIEKKKASEQAAKEKLKSLNKAAGEVEKKKQEIELEIEDSRESYSAQEIQLQQAKLEVDKLKEEEKDCDKTIKGYDKTLKTNETEVKILEEQIKNLSSARNMKQRNQRVEENKKKLADLDKEMSEINDEINSLGIERDSIERNQEDNKKEVENEEYQRKALSIKSSNLKKELAELERSGYQQLAMFDTRAPKVAAKIKEAVQQNRFRSTPIGPVGSYVKLTREASSLDNLPTLLETELGAQTIRSYLCDSDLDRKVLWEIFNSVYGNSKKPSIFTSKFLTKKHDVNRVQEQKTVMDYIEITGSPQEQCVVFNYLVDQRQIEASVIVKTQDEAKKLCTFINNVPEFMSYCLTLDFNKFHPPTKFTSYRSYYINAVEHTVLGANMNAKVEEKKEELIKTQDQMQECERKIDNLNRRKASFDQQVEEIKTKIAELRKKLAKCNTSKSQLKAEEDPSEHSESLQEKLEERRKSLVSTKKSQQEVVERKKQIKTACGEKSKEMNNLLKKVNSLRKVSDPLESQKSQIEGQLSTRRKEIMNQEKVTKRIIHDISEMNKTLNQLKSAGVKVEQKLRQLDCPPDLIPSGSVKQLSERIKNIKAQIAKESGIDNMDEIEQELVRLRELYESNKKKIVSLESNISQLEEMNDDRNTNFLYIRTSVTNMVQRRFSNLSEVFSQEFGTKIYINLNHKKRELNWEFRSKEGDTLKTDIQSLSGGEKSYAQVKY